MDPREGDVKAILVALVIGVLVTAFAFGAFIFIAVS